jgi:hypothetical protein
MNFLGVRSSPVQTDAGLPKQRPRPARSKALTIDPDPGDSQMKKLFYHLLMILVCVACLSTAHFAQSFVFTYQGNLNLSGQPANGNFDFEFALFDAVTAGNQLGVTQAISNVAVADGLFTVNLNFNNNFTGDPRFLEIRVRQAGQPGYTTLSPRQVFNSTPYAIKSRRADEASVAVNAEIATTAFQATNATTATNALNLGGVAANQFVLTGDVRLTNARLPLPGSADYIQNTNTPQATSNFNISGDGTAGGKLSGNIVNAATQFDLGGVRIFAAPGTANLFAGRNAGQSTTGNGNSFFGNSAGSSNTTSDVNSFFGVNTGANATGAGNSFFGALTGSNSTTGVNNAFFGIAAGLSNTMGSNNTLVGPFAEVLSSGLTNATAIGSRAAVSQNNSLVLGSISGVNGANAGTNVGIGTTAPTERLHVEGNGLFTGNLTVNGTITGAGGGVTGLSASNITSGTLANDRLGQVPTVNIADGAVTSAKIPAGQVVKGVNGLQDNVTLAAGANISITPAGNVLTINSTTPPVDAILNQTTLQAAANFNISGSGTASGTLSGNIINANTQFNLNGRRILREGIGSLFVGPDAGNNSSGDRNSYFGNRAGFASSTGFSNTLIGSSAGTKTGTGSGNSFVGVSAGQENTTGNSNSFFGASSGLRNGTGSRNTFIGAQSDFTVSPASGDRNTLLGSDTAVTAGLNNATAIGSRAAVAQSDSLVLGSINAVNGATADTNVGIGTTAPTERLHIATNGGNLLVGGAGCPAGTIGIGLNGPFGSCTSYSVRGDGQSVFINRPTGGLVVFRENNGSSQVLIHPGGSLDLRVLGTSGGTALCRNASNIIAFCSSSLRYKKNIVSFAPGMSFIRQLQPIAYEWKADGLKDVGFGAEDIAKIDTRFVTYNDKGEVEGIKYDRLSTAFVNAFTEQQTEIETLRKKLGDQQAELDALKSFICSQTPTAAICRTKKEEK